MKQLGHWLSITLLGLLTAGYGASQWAYQRGNAAEYAMKVDTAPVKLLALGLLLGSLLLGLRKDEEAD